MKSLNDVLLELERLYTELEQDLMYCTTRDSHIRMSTRMAALAKAIRTLRDTTAPSDTVVL